MTDTQLSFAVGLPCLTVIASLVTNLLMMSNVRKDIREIRNDMKSLSASFALMAVKVAHSDGESV